MTRVLFDDATKEHRLLDHPFYKAWAAGTLDRDDLAFYAAQYWHQVEAFPGYLQQLAGRLPEGRARTIVEANLRDEVDGDHAGLWLQFSTAVGANSDAIAASVPTEETKKCVESFEQGMQQGSLPFALGMLYGYESQTPEVAETKVEGLKNLYDVDEAGRAYFELHGELDVEHAAELADAIDEVVCTESDRAAARDGAVAGARAVWGLLDGVTRAREIC
ncbi:MAG: iron-containing redox enzyme family protein [Actinomycetota bacterium]|nr:iron-containing redox enzyme family protein [Actinomycetota bacterium]